MEKEVELAIIDIEIVFKEESSESWNADVTNLMMIDVLKSIVGLDILQLPSDHLHYSKPFEDFD